ncbi:MAG: SNF2-related protein [Planctomycetaceae bacterium]
MTLAEFLESRFRGDIRFRGAAYLKAERVSVARVTADHLFAIVRDGVEYQTQLSREDDQLKMYCNCASGSQPEVACKHLWATILAADEQGYVTASLKPGYIPPFAHENVEWAPDEEEWDFDDGGDVYQPPSSRWTVQAPAPVQAQLRPWEARLESLRQAMQFAETSGPTTDCDREIYYEIDVELSQSAGQLVIQTSQRQRRANGTWGKLKPLKLRPGQLEEIEREDDSTILAYLSGANPERTNWYAQQAQMQTSVYRYRIPHELCRLILPSMCATGRVRYLNSREKNPTALEWDNGPPWELAVGLVFDDAEQQWRLEGKLRRDETSISTKATRLLLPGGLVMTDKKIGLLCDFDAFEWIKLISGKDAVAVPAGEEHELVDQLFDMPALPRLELPEDLQLEEVRCEPVPQLTVRAPRGARWRLERLQGDLSFDYLGTSIRGSSARWAIVQRDQGRCLVRNRAVEERAWSQLAEHGFRRLIDQKRGGHDVEIAASDLGKAVRFLIAEGWQVQADGKHVRQPGEMQFRVKSGIDWFELHGDVDFEGRTASFPELLSALARGDSTVRLDDGSLGIIPEKWLQQFGLLAGLGIAHDEHLRFSHNQVALLDALLAAQPSVDYDDKFRNLRDRFHSFEGIAPRNEPAKFHGELRGYQREGLGWLEFLQEFHLGGCLADDMGLGKTVQLLALLLDRRERLDKRVPSLVVVPKSLLFNWQQECERFTPQLKVLEYSGLNRAPLREQFHKYDIVLTTYGTLRRDVLELREVRFDYVVLDEAQTIKNSGSQVAKASRLLEANHRIALSGTPIENHLGDLWSIFEFLNPGMLGRSSAFKSYTADDKDDKAHELLSAGLRPFILRRTKKQVANELPDKLEQTIYCELNEKQRRLYDELREHYRVTLLGLVEEQGLDKSSMHVLEALLRLRQAACHPALLDRQSDEESSAKLDVLCPHLEELIDEGHKTLVFSQFTSMLAIVRKHLDKRNIVYEYLDGQTRDRKACVERFQTDPECGVFLISLKAGGLGLNLTAADYVFILDPWWNPAAEAQAIDRAHRVGQTRQVFAYRLICRNTVEEKIAELQSRKRNLADAILTADSTTLRDLSTEDLKMLLS